MNYVVSLSKTLCPRCLVLGQPGKSGKCLDMTENLLTGIKCIYINKQNTFYHMRLRLGVI